MLLELPSSNGETDGVMMAVTRAQKMKQENDAIEHKTCQNYSVQKF